MTVNVAREWWRPKPAGGVSRRAPRPTSSPSGGAVPFVALLGFTFVLLVAPQSFFPTLASLRIAMVMAVLAIGSYVLEQGLRGLGVAVRALELRSAVGLALWGAVTIPTSVWPGGSLAFLQDQYLKVLAIFWLIANVVNTVPRFRRVLWALTLMSIPTAAVGVANYASGNYLRSDVDARIQGYVSPLANNPNDLALLLNLMIPVATALLVGSRSKVCRMVLLSVVALDVTAIVVTFSRAGFVTLAILLVLYGRRLMKDGRRGLVLALVALALCALPLLPVGYVNRITTITDIDADVTGSAEARWTDMVAAVKLLLAHPLLGTGIGQDILALNDARGDTWRAVHNAYLQCAVDLGVIGLGLFSLVVIASIRSTGLVVTRGLQTTGSEELVRLTGGVRMSLIAFAVGAMLAPVAYHFYLYYFAGLAVAARQILARETASTALEAKSARG